jgi:hypothetical protein
VSYSPADLEAIAKKLRMDLSNAQGKLTDLMNGMAELASKLPDQGEKLACPQCGVQFSGTEVGARKLTEHLENVHGLREQVKA